MIEAAMAAHKFMLSEFPWDERHRVTGIEEVLTPALVVYPDIVASNIARTLQLLESMRPIQDIRDGVSVDLQDYVRLTGAGRRYLERLNRES